jgi:predicted transcriptional regulator
VTVILGCALGILKGAIGILWWLLAPKPVRKERRKISKSAHRARAKVPKQVKKLRRAARRGKLRWR